MELSLDVMLGSFKDYKNDYLYGTFVGDASAAYDLVIDDFGVVTEGTFDNAQHEFKSYTSNRIEDFEQIGFSFDWQWGIWNFDGLIGYSKTEHERPVTQLKWTYNATLHQKIGKDGVSRSSPDFDMTRELDEFTFDMFEKGLYITDDHKKVVQLDISRELNLKQFPLADSIQFGLRNSNKMTERWHGYTTIKGPSLTQNADGTVTTDTKWVGNPMTDAGLAALVSVIPGGPFMGGINDKFDSWDIVTNEAGFALYDYPGIPYQFRPGDYYKVEEEVLGLYVMTDLFFDLLDYRTQMNVGIRYVKTNQTSTGYQSGGMQWNGKNVINRDYSDWLPSLNVRVDLSNELLLRLAMAQVMSRAQLSQLSGRWEISTNNRQINAGNPHLKPLRADQFDVSLEYYFSSESLVSLSYFYKDLESFISYAYVGKIEYGAQQYDLSTYVNAEGSTLEGVEFIFQMPFTFLPAPFNAMGLNLNYTYVDSSKGNISELGLEVPLFGLSQNSANVTVFYENNSIDMRLSYNYRDEAVTELNTNIYAKTIDDYGQLDFSAGYQINENFKLTLKVINVTDEQSSSYYIREAYPNSVEKYGKRISLGLRASF
jgi:iron complex outermembrane recepter protein